MDYYKAINILDLSHNFNHEQLKKSWHLFYHDQNSHCDSKTHAIPNWHLNNTNSKIASLYRTHEKKPEQ